MCPCLIQSQREHVSIARRLTVAGLVMAVCGSALAAGAAQTGGVDAITVAGGFGQGSAANQFQRDVGVAVDARATSSSLTRATTGYRSGSRGRPGGDRGRRGLRGRPPTS